MITSSTSRDHSVITLKLIGCAESDMLDSLVTMLADVHSEAIAASATRVAVDLRGLEFATSSCLKALVSWLLRVEETPDRYAITFHSTSKHSWQRRSLTAMAACAPDVVTIENEPA